MALRDGYADELELVAERQQASIENKSLRTPEIGSDTIYSLHVP